jgi:hypothetical protein
MGRGFLKSIMDDLPNFAADAFMRFAVFPQLNVTVSNVRGPEVPLYMAGARLVHFYPVSIAMDHIGLNHTGFSYNGVMWITAVACRNMMPDPAFYADCLRGSFDELITAIDALPSAAHPAVPGTKHAHRVPKPVPRPRVRIATAPGPRAQAKATLKSKAKKPAAAVLSSGKAASGSGNVKRRPKAAVPAPRNAGSRRSRAARS